MKNEPAFPVAEGPADNVNPGMTLRDYFAAKAMQGFLIAAEGIGFNETIAVQAYGLAAAMLAARDGKE